MKKAIKEYAGKKLESGDPMMYDVSVNRTIEQYLALYSSLIRGGGKKDDIFDNHRAGSLWRSAPF